MNILKYTNNIINSEKTLLNELYSLWSKYSLNNEIHMAPFGYIYKYVLKMATWGENPEFGNTLKCEA